MGFTLEFDLTPEQAAAFLALADRRTYVCEDCECGRELLVARVVTGFDVTLVDPEFEAYIHLTPAELAQWIEYGEGEFWVSSDGNEGSIDLTAAQLADLRAWAMGEVGA